MHVRWSMAEQGAFLDDSIARKLSLYLRLAIASSMASYLLFAVQCASKSGREGTAIAFFFCWGVVATGVVISMVRRRRFFASIRSSWTEAIFVEIGRLSGVVRLASGETISMRWQAGILQSTMTQIILAESEKRTFPIKIRRCAHEGGRPRWRPCSVPETEEAKILVRDSARQQ